MNLNLLKFIEKHVPHLRIIFFSEKQIKIWDERNIEWARVEKVGNQEDEFKITSIQFKSLQTNNKEQLKEFLQQLNLLVENFWKEIEPLLEQAQKQHSERQKEITNYFKKSFSKEQNTALEPIFRILSETGHSPQILPQWIANFEFWNAVYENTNFKKSFFRRQEILKAFQKFYNISHKSKSKVFWKSIPSSYQEIKVKTQQFATHNSIKEIQFLQYGVLNAFFEKESSPSEFILLIQNVFQNQKPEKVWLNNHSVFQSLDTETEQKEVGFSSFFGTFHTFSDLLLGFSLPNQVFDVALQAKKIISQTDIFGLSQNALLLSKIESQMGYDLVVLNPKNQWEHSAKEISLYVSNLSSSKPEKQFLTSLQKGVKNLSEEGTLVLFLGEEGKNLIEKTSLLPFRKLLEGHFERIEIYQKESSFLFVFQKKTQQEKGIFYVKINAAFSHPLQATFIQNTWKPKPKLSDYEKLIPTTNTEKSNRKPIFKTFFRATQKLEEFIEKNIELENNLKDKVKLFQEKFNTNLIKEKEQITSKFNKKKRKLLSEMAQDTLFENQILEEVEEKVNREQQKVFSNENQFLKFEEKNLIQTQVSVFEEGVWYYEKAVFEKDYDLDKLFPKRKQGENILMFFANTKNGGEIWATDKPVPPSFLNDILPYTYIFPFYFYENGKKKSNLSEVVIQKFRTTYTSIFEKREQKAEDLVRYWFDLSAFEFLQINPALALELQRFSNLMNEEESKVAKEFLNYYKNPKKETHLYFEQLKKVFFDTKRAFERLKNKATRNRESYLILENYFLKGEETIDFLEQFWRKLELEEAENFKVPTEENMTQEAILHYIFGVWNHQGFKEKYREELKNQSPRIPIYKDFHHFSEKGSILLQKFIPQNSSSSNQDKIELEAVEMFEDENSQKKQRAKKTKIWFSKENKIWYNNTTFLQTATSLDLEKLKAIKIDEMSEKSFLEKILKYLRKNKADLTEGKKVLETVLNFLNNFL